MRNLSTALRIIVGLFFILGMLVFGYFTIILSSSNLFGKNYLYKVEFSHINGLNSSAPISVRGVPVGKVKKILGNEDYSKIIVILNLTKPLIFYNDYRIYVKVKSILGGKLLEIDLGNPKSGEFKGILQGSSEGNPLETLEKLIGEIRDSQIINNIDKILMNIVKVSSEVNQFNVLEKVTKLLDTVTVLGEFSLDFFKKLLDKNGSFLKLVQDDAIYNLIVKFFDKGTKTLFNIEKTFGHASILLEKFEDNITNNKGTVAKLINDEKFYNNLNKIFNNANAAIEDFREQAPIQTFGSIIFNAL